MGVAWINVFRASVDSAPEIAFLRQRRNLGAVAGLRGLGPLLDDLKVKGFRP